MDRAEYDSLRTRLMKERAGFRRIARRFGVLWAVDAYFNMGDPGWAFRLNRRLRGHRLDDETKKATSALDAALAVSKSAAPKVLYRGIALKNIPHWANVHFSSYLSTSFMPLQALLYAGSGSNATVLRLHSDGELPVLFAPREDECMLPRGTKWTVTGHREFAVPHDWTVHPIHGDFKHVVPPKVQLWDLRYEGPTKQTKSQTISAKIT